MRRLGYVRDLCLNGLALIGALAVVLLMLHVVADIGMRNLRNAPIPATYEVVTHYYMIALAFVPLAWVEKSGGMVQVEVINGALSPRMLVASDFLVAAISAGVYAVLTWVTWQTAMRHTGIGTFVMSNNTMVPTWPAFWLPPLGFALAAVVAAARLAEPFAKEPRP